MTPLRNPFGKNPPITWHILGELRFRPSSLFSCPEWFLLFQFICIIGSDKMIPIKYFFVSFFQDTAIIKFQRPSKLG